MTALDERTREFLRELAALCQKHYRSIDGCGCCGSPFIIDEHGEIVAERLSVSVAHCRVDGTEVTP